MVVRMIGNSSKPNGRRRKRRKKGERVIDFLAIMIGFSALHCSFFFFFSLDLSFL
jgi:hypothetical protein